MGDISKHFNRAEFSCQCGCGFDTVADCLEELYPEKYGIGRYPSFVHIDVRKEKARWNKR